MFVCIFWGKNVSNITNIYHAAHLVNGMYVRLLPLDVVVAICHMLFAIHMSNLIEVAFSRCGKATKKNKTANDDDVAIVVVVVVDNDVVALAEFRAFYFCPLICLQNSISISAQTTTFSHSNDNY